ncbi:MAG: OPT/YSL family transporter, partial [Thermoplasmata archaeon]|nr:OPT/YSL family transporter [Thermoplasmata archaeon]
FRTATQDLMKIREKGGGGPTAEFQPGYGWYEWPMSHIIVMVVVTFIGTIILFASAGYPVPQVTVLAFLLVATTFFLGAIAVKVMGETSIEPVSGTSFIVLMMLVGSFKAMGTGDTETVVLAIVGTTVFGGAISMSGNIVTDFKNSLYIGNRPYQQMRAEVIGIVPGAIVAGFFAVIFSEQLAKGELNLIAPQAHAFAFFTKILVGGDVNMNIFMLGFAIGIFMELVTGMGTAFGLGMYFPLGLAFPLMLGGGLRDIWQARVFEKRAKAENWDERKKTMKLLDTYMLATGLIIGEALVGTVVAIFLFSFRGWV